MSLIYADRTMSRFFLIPEDADSALPAGSFSLRTLGGEVRQVDEAALKPYEIPEARAQAVVEETVATAQAILGELKSALGELATDLAKAMNPEGRLMRLLSSLGVSLGELQSDTAGTLDRLRKRMMGMSLDRLKALLPGQSAT